MPLLRGVKMKTIIVTRHPGALIWLQTHHPELTDVTTLSHAGEDDLKGNIVVGHGDIC